MTLNETAKQVNRSKSLFLWRWEHVESKMAVGFVSALLSFLLLLLAANCNAQSSYCSRTYNSSSGTIMSPNYPSSYNSYSDCVYTVAAPLPSSIAFTIRALALEPADRCTYDWIEVSCNSTYSSSVPVRYCGSANNLSPLVLSSCSRAVIRFRSDGSISYSGFLIDYRVTPGCGENCTLNSTECPVGCMMAYSSYYQYQYEYCFCRMPLSAVTTASTSCPSGCSYEYDFYGRRTCRCPQVTTEAPCPYGCTRRTYWYGYSTCECNVTAGAETTSSCPYGCYNDRDFWGYRFCNCRVSTQPPIWCSPGCTSALDYYGRRYCQCQTSTVRRCSYPCYYLSNYNCYCPPSTTSPSSVCGLTAFNSYGIITSPNYPSVYSSQEDCYQFISISGGATSMKIQILDLDLYFERAYVCSDNYIQITGCDGSRTTFCSYSSLSSSTLEFRCDRYSSSSQTTIRFHPMHQTSYNRAYRGFKIAYSARYSPNCSYSGVYLTEGSSGVVTSPNYPNSFSAYTECTNYLYTDQQGLRIHISFEQLRLESYSTCREVFLVLTCEGNDWPINRTVCGYTIPSAMTFNCRTLKIFFKANYLSYTFAPRSFSLRYYATKVIDQTTYSYVVTKPGTLSTYTLGLSLGLGGGGLLFVILIVLIIAITVKYRRQMARMEQRHLQELTVLCRNMRDNGSAGTGANVMFSRGGGNNGAPNGLSYDLLSFEPPPYVHPGLNGGIGAGTGARAGTRGGGGGGGGGGVAGEDPEHPPAHFDSDEALLLP